MLASGLTRRLTRRLTRQLCCFSGLMASLMISGCVSVKTEHRIEPIQITMDVNVRLERELEKSFGELDARSREIAANQNQKEAE